MKVSRKNHIINNMLIIMFFIYSSPTNSTLTESKIILLFCFLFSLIIFIKRKRKIGVELLTVISLWFVVNIISIAYNNPFDHSVITLFTRTGLIIMFYFILKSIGVSFFNLFVKYIFILSVISLPFYIVDASMPGLFDSLSPYLNIITKEAQKEVGGWYIGIYMHNAWAYLPTIGLYRNSGFMWEPSAYGMMLIVALSIKLSVSKGKWDNKSKFLGVCLLTTFSTAAYIAFIFLLLYSLLKKDVNNKIVLVLYVSVLFIISFYLIQLDFIGTKINYFIQTSEESYYFEGGDVWRVNRISILVYNFEQSLVNPFGNGLYESSYLIKKYQHTFSGSNTIANVLYVWGYLGVFFLITYSFKFFSRSLNNNNLLALILMAAYFSVLFSNDMDFKPLIYTVGFFPIIFKNKTINL